MEWLLKESCGVYNVENEDGELIHSVDACCEEDVFHAVLISFAPALREALRKLESAARARETPQGDPCAYLQAKAELAEAARNASETLVKIDAKATDIWCGMDDE